MSLEVWLARVDEKRVPRYHFQGWLRWLRVNGGKFCGFGPDELVGYQRVHAGYELLDLVQAYVRGLSLRVSSKRRVYASLRSFFLHNRVALPGDPSFRVTGDLPPVRSSLSLEEVRRLVDVCNPMHRAAFLSMVQGGMGVDEFLYWNETGLRDLQRQLRDEVRFVRVDLPGRKRNRNVKPYYTLLGGDAVEALRNYVRLEPHRGPYIFLNVLGQPPSHHGLWQYWMRKLVRLGMIQRPEKPGNRMRYGKHLHELRDVFRTRWQKSGAEALVAEFCMGHTVDNLGYNKAMEDQAYVTREYRKAEPWLNIVTENPEKVSVDSVEEVRSQMEKRIRELERGNERAQKLDMLLEDPDVYQAFVETLQRLKERKT